MKGFHLGRFIMTAVVVLAVIAIATRIAPVRRFVFNA
jgi:hypothetical protein